MEIITTPVLMDDLECWLEVGFISTDQRSYLELAPWEKERILEDYRIRALCAIHYTVKVLILAENNRNEHYKPFALESKHIAVKVINPITNVTETFNFPN